MSTKDIALSLGRRSNELEIIREQLKSKKDEKSNLLRELEENQELSEDEVKKIGDTVETLTEEIKGLETEEKDVETQVHDLETELDDAQRAFATPNGEERKRQMKNENEIRTQEDLLTEERSAVNEYIRSSGQVREGFTSVEGDAIIPVGRETKPVLEKGNNELNLAQYVNTVPVTTGSGSYPILKKTKAKLYKTSELAKNQTLANPEFHEVDYKIETYRGAIPISQESIDDSDADLVGIVEDHIARMSVNTDNDEIASILKTFAKVKVSNIDEIKAVKNIKLDRAYNKMFILSQSFYNLIDTVKDNNNRYLFQESLVSPTGYMFLGIPADIANDEQLGTKGQANAFFGDVEAAVTKFDRKQIGVRWTDHYSYGEFLQGGKRMDIKKVDENAGFFITADAGLTVGPIEPETPGE